MPFMKVSRSFIFSHMPFEILSINQPRAKQYYEKHCNFHFLPSNIPPIQKRHYGLSQISLACFKDYRKSLLRRLRLNPLSKIDKTLIT